MVFPTVDLSKFKSFFALLLFLFSSIASTHASVSGSAPSEFQAQLQMILDVARETYGVDEISIGGGTARALIQHVMLGTSFEFRDFDIVFSAHREVTRESAQRMGLELERRGLGKYSAENLRPRPRYNPNLPREEALRYNAGFGFYVISPEQLEFDISIFHSNAAMELNGILDTDKLRIRIKSGSNISQILRNRESFLNALADPQEGVNAALGLRQPRIVNWGALEAEPANVLIRITRGLAKFGALPYDELTLRKIREAIQNRPNESPLQLARNLLKLFEDRTWLLSFQNLVGAGLFTHQFKSFSKALESAEFLNSATLEDRIRSLLLSASTEDALKFLKLLSDLEPQLIESILPQLIREKRLKVGYFSGEFGPFHLGHLGVVQTALTSGGLDLVFVIPTPHPTHGPRTSRFSQVEWAERRAFVKEGIRNETKAWLWPSDQQASGIRNLSSAIEGLHSTLGLSSPLTHVFGMDSFHRVLDRGLLEADPRPRIAVTRPGVPLPEGFEESQVRIVNNVYSQPISSTRILHELAISGNTEKLSKGVRDLVLNTPRYREILRRSIVLRNEAERSLRQVTRISQDTLIWDPRENHSGLWSEDFPEFNSSHHARILERLVQIGSRKLIIYIDDASPAKLSWINGLRQFNRGTQRDFRVSSDYAYVPDHQRVMVLHSGRANETLAAGYFPETYRGVKGLIIYETPDQPISPLIRSLDRPIILNYSEAVRCESLFIAAGA